MAKGCYSVFDIEYPFGNYSKKKKQRPLSLKTAATTNGLPLLLNQGVETCQSGGGSTRVVSQRLLHWGSPLPASLFLMPLT